MIDVSFKATSLRFCSFGPGVTRQRCHNNHTFIMRKDVSKVTLGTEFYGHHYGSFPPFSKKTEEMAAHVHVFF